MASLEKLQRYCNTTRLPGYICVFFYLISSPTTAECVQITLSYINRAYFIRYINSSMAIILFLFPLHANLKNKHKTNKKTTPHPENKTSSIASNNIIEGSFSYFIAYTIIGCILHTGGGFLYYLSLTGTSVPTATSLKRLKGIWVYILSIIFLKQILSIWKCFAVITAFMGIFCYVLEVSNYNYDLHKSDDTWWGCFASLAAGVTWSLCDVWTNITYKKYFPNSKYYGSILYEAFIGFWTIFIFWFVIFIEQPIFDENTDKYLAWKWIIISGVALTITNAAFFVALNLTSPVFMNYASFLTVPVSFFMDYIVHDYKITILPVLGALCIILGFVMLEIVAEPEWFTKIIKHIKLKVFGHEKEDIFAGSDAVQLIKNVKESVQVSSKLEETTL